MRDNRGALVAWVVAGIVLVLSLLQVVIVGLAGTETTAASILVLPGFYSVAVAVESGGAVVSVLCLLATALWLGEGVGLFVREERRIGFVFGGGAGVLVVLLFGWLALSAVSGGVVGPLVVAGLLSIITLGGVVGALVLTPESSFDVDDSPSGPRDTGGDRTDSDLDSPTQRIDDATLDRLEQVAPDAVPRAREYDGRGAPVPEVESELYRGIENALVDGALDMSVISTYGQRYDVVNLPSQYREIELPTVGGRCHIGELDRQVREWIDDEDTPLRDIAIAVEAIADHRADIEQHIRKHEEEFDELLDEIDSDLESIRTLTTELDGTVGDRTRMLVIENRHSEFDGVGAIEAEISAAKEDLHRCSFTEATQTLRELRSESEALLTAVDFLRSLVGGIEHGQHSARLPNRTAKQLYIELESLLEQQYDATLSLEDERVIVEDTGRDIGRAKATSETVTGSSGRNSEHTQDSAGRNVSKSVEPTEVTDEILYILRELKRAHATGNTVEYQTEQLPDSIGDAGVLNALTAFCRRQSDIVEQVTLQENAPPGFFEIQFTDRTTVDAGIDDLISRFLDRYGSGS